MALLGKVEYVERVISEICVQYGVSVDDVKNPRRRWYPIMDARRAICKYLLDKTNMSLMEIAIYLGQSPKGARMRRGLFKFEERANWLKSGNSQATLL